MTREEALQILDTIPTIGEQVDALEMAIKALEQEPCDCISRAEALKEMQIYHDDCAKTSKYTRLGFETAMNLVESLPSIQPKPKTGHWIDITNKNGTVIAIRCDCCGNSPKHAIRSNFCPNCGAKMESEDI